MRKQRNKRQNIPCTTSSKNAGLEEYMIESQEIKRHGIEALEKAGIRVFMTREEWEKEQDEYKSSHIHGSENTNESHRE
jgi:hypothetical protein